ncbi:MAG: hypothetical protein IJL04_01260 [Bacteroidales bacterium]|nr:hypothetical protein [Bacteroidales bacterium]
MAKIRKPTDKQLLEEWRQYYESFISDVEVDTEESQEEKLKRIARLEANDEEWFKYYFPSYCTAEPAAFHKAATKRLMEHSRWYEVRAWSRELAKSARSMMEILKLGLTRKICNVLLISNSFDNACRLLLPFQLQLEKNARIINDYGDQINPGNWEEGQFVAKCGCSFRAIGAGQSPRGTRNEAKRPDFILVDDIDTDEECRNPDRIKAKWDWIEQALIPTVSVSGDIRILFNGNIIAKDCCIIRAGKVADCFDIVNIRDKHGKSSWPEKNSEADIDFILSKISTRSAQQEYFNNPIAEGTVFKELTWGKVPPLRRFPFLVNYSDPSPSNNLKKASSRKAMVLMGYMDGVFYVIDTRDDHATSAQFVDWFYEINEGIPQGIQVYNYIENNTLQDPFYQQVFLPLFAERGKKDGFLNISPDTRKKPEKFSRIEGNLEPLNRQGRLVFNEDKKGNPHMERLAEEFILLTEQLKAPADGADCTEGAYFILNGKIRTLEINSVSVGRRPRNRKRV